MKKTSLLLVSLFVFNSCLKAPNPFEGKYNFRTLHYIKTANDYKKLGRDHFLLGKGNVKIYFNENSKKHMVSIKYRQPRANRLTRTPKIKYRNYNFNVKNIVLMKDTLRFTLTANWETVMLEGKIFKAEKGYLIFAIEKEFTKYGHINNKSNPWFYKIDNEFVYYKLDINTSTEKDFYKQQVVFMKDSINNNQLKKRKRARLKNGITYLESLVLK